MRWYLSTSEQEDSVCQAEIFNDKEATKRSTCGGRKREKRISLLDYLNTLRGMTMFHKIAAHTADRIQKKALR